MRRMTLAIAALALAGLFAACGDDDPSVVDSDSAVGADADDGDDTPTSEPDAGDGAAGGTCLAGDPDCQDMGPTDEDAEQAARAYLGVTRDELPDDVRIARVDDEQFMLTEDYVIGRYTVELDSDDTGTPRVTKVTVELEDGPLVVTA